MFSKFFTKTACLFLSLALLPKLHGQNPASDPTNAGNWIPYAPMTDEFDGANVDVAKWRYGTPNWTGRAPVFHKGENSSINNGKLILTAKKEAGLPAGFLYSAGYLTSRDMRRYGYFEISCRAVDNLLVSSFWLKGGNRVWDREIDILEIGAGNPNRFFQYTSNFHTAVTTTPTGLSTTDTTRPQFKNDLTFRPIDDFHTYGCEWNKDQCKFYIDGVLVRTAATLDFQIANIMYVGMEFNTFFAEKMANQITDADIEHNGTPAEYRVEYVRAWIKPENPTRYYVDSVNGNDSNSGLSWNTAKKTITRCVAEAYDGDTIWVARGTYNESVTIAGVRNMKVLGGFVSGATTELSRRPDLNPTIISSQHGYGAVQLEGTTNVIVDGFTVTGVNRDFESGFTVRGPMQNTLVKNCIITGNQPLNGAGAGTFIDADRSFIEIDFENCTFSNNKALGNFSSGGASAGRNAYNAGFNSCKFINNEAPRGGAIQINHPGAIVAVTNSVFAANISANSASIDTQQGALTLTNSTLHAPNGDHVRMTPSVQFANSKIHNNIFSDSAIGGIDLAGTGTLPTGFLSNNLFHNNLYMIDRSGLQTTIANVNSQTYASNNIAGDPLYTNEASNDLQITSSSPAIDQALQTSAPASDLLGILRPQGSGVDIGAYEYTVPVYTGIFIPANVGGSGLQNNITFTNNNYCLESNSLGFSSTTDQLYFPSIESAGDHYIIAKIDTITSSSANAHAGVMIRESNADNSPYFAVQQRADKKVAITSRRFSTETVITDEFTGDTTNAKYIKITRIGNKFRGYYSIDGSNWIFLGFEQTITMPSSVRTGLFTYSSSSSSFAKAAFSEAAITNGIEALFTAQITNPSKSKSIATMNTGFNIALNTNTTNPQNTAGLTTNWTLTGTGAAFTFRNATSASVSANSTGSVVIRYTISDGSRSVSDERTLYVGSNPGNYNLAPYVYAGENQLALHGQAISLNGTMTDTNPITSAQWFAIGGNTGVTIGGTANSPSRTAVFSTSAGTSKNMRMQVSDGDITSFDDLTVTLLTDTDNDGISDTWEDLYTLNKNSAADATLDSDGDGYTNREEFLFDSSPLNGAANAQLHISDTALSLAFPTSNKRRYEIQVSNTLTGNDWQAIGSMLGNGTQITFPVTPDNAKKFYRLAVRLAP